MGAGNGLQFSRIQNLSPCIDRGQGKTGGIVLSLPELLGVTPQTICGWVKAYLLGGPGGLKSKRKGRPKGGKLLPWQAAQIAKTVIEHHPEQLKLPFYLWTREAVARLIKHRFGMQLSVWTVGRYLKRWGFTPQQPAPRAWEQNPEQVRQWLEKEYPSIRRQAQREKARIYWNDDMGLLSEHAVGRPYGLQGQKPVNLATGQRFGCNMICAITNQGRLNFMVFKARFTAQVFLEFLRRLLRQSDRRLYLIIDRHPVHRSLKVQNWVKENGARLRLVFLPNYSPEITPDALRNQDIKSNTLGWHRPGNQTELMGKVRSYLRSRRCKPNIVANYFPGKHVQYAA
jgi:transposase